MNKVLLVGVIGVIIIGLGVLAFSLSTNLSFDNNEGILDSSQGENEESEEKSKPQGRDLSIEFEEKMGISTP